MRSELLSISALDYEPHAMHQPDRPWTESNCWTDACLEMLHALRQEPFAVSACAVATDFEGDQWQMYKFPPEDIWQVYGIEIHEMNPYRALDTQVADLLELGRLMTIEVDAWFLPDTRGISYRVEHKKTSIIVNAIDRDARELGYFHNAGYHEAGGEDYDGLLGVGLHSTDNVMVPYVELVDLDHMRHPTDDELTRDAHALLRKHLARRPRTNPVHRMAARFERDVPWVADAGEPAFHAYAFVTARQAGAAADLARGFCAWLAERDPEVAEPLLGAALAWTELSDAAKSLQLKLARVAHGREVDLTTTFEEMGTAWATAQAHLDGLAT